MILPVDRYPKSRCKIIEEEEAVETKEEEEVDMEEVAEATKEITVIPIIAIVMSIEGIMAEVDEEVEVTKTILMINP